MMRARPLAASVRSLDCSTTSSLRDGRWRALAVGAVTLLVACLGRAMRLDSADAPLPLALRVAHEYRLSEFQTDALVCIRKVENGGPGIEYGVLHPDALYTSELTQARWAAGSIKKRLPSASALPAFANRWAPPGADNDPDGLNEHWLPNMQACLAGRGTSG